MKKLITAMLFCAPLSAMAADATVDLTFKGTLLQPTCSSSFVGTDGTDIAFGNINASDFVTMTSMTAGNPLADGSTIGTAKNVFLQFTGCGGGVSQFNIEFGGPEITGYGVYSDKAPLLRIKDSPTVRTGLGFALFRNSTTTSVDDAIKFRSGKFSLAITDLTKDGETYKLPLYARIIMEQRSNLDTSAEINRLAGSDLIASAWVKVDYQ